ncbi:hypothetical protein CDA63_17455 [Hymenobacter amundsenii]|uniref:Uncharacterized protein n=1 Tax=Hymenobacter amundsenii TaxID=2006685 RepID=A0A246FH19_9BACT|nr:hypothetical protein CDA63_17455 [Hymenobacter amundsenii]
MLLQSLAALKSQYGEQGQIELEHDFYWDISDDQRYAIYQEPQGFTIGQLSEDSQIIRESQERGIIGFDLLKAAHLLRYIGHTHPIL